MIIWLDKYMPKLGPDLSIGCKGLMTQRVIDPEYAKSIAGIRYRIESYAMTRPRTRPNTNLIISASLKKSKKHLTNKLKGT